MIDDDFVLIFLYLLALGLHWLTLLSDWILRFF